MLLITCAARAQTTHWTATGGNWAQDADWTGGKPTGGVDAYVGSAGGHSTAAVTIVGPGQECRYLYVGHGDGNDGTVTIEPGGGLTAERLYVGYNGSGTIRQNGGTCTVERLSVGDGVGWAFFPPVNGVYELIDGNLDAGYIQVSPTYTGQFTQSGGRITTGGMQIGNPDGWGEFRLVDGTLINSGYLGLDQGNSFIQEGGFHEVKGMSMNFGMSYRKTGGELLVTGNVYLSSASWFRNEGGDAHIRGNVTAEEMGQFLVRGGSVHIDGNMLLAEVQQERPRLELQNPDGQVTVGGTVTLRGRMEISCAVGAQLHLGGAGFVNELTHTTGLYGLNNLAVVLEGGADQVAVYEAAGEDVGPDPNGFVGNYTIGTLRIGGEDDVGVVQLVDDFENTAGDALPEAVYVERLVVEPGCTLDLNGLSLYYVTGGVDPAGTVLLHGGNLIQVPEPTAVGLLSVGGLALLRRKR